MTRNIMLVIISICSFSVFAQKRVKCIINTDSGNIEMILYPQKAPKTVANFLRYIDSGLYNKSSFFRVCTPQNEAGRDVKIEVIQGGNIPEGSSYDPIVIETTEETGILHKDGVVSMARAEPNSATSSFFICIKDQPELDFGGARNPDGQGFAAFGKVTKGMEVVRKVQSGKNEGQVLLEPVTINSISRLSK